MAAYFEALVAQLPQEPKLCANWVMGELAGWLNREGLEIGASPISPGQLAGLLRRLLDGTLSGKLAKEVFEAMARGEARGEDAADRIIDARGLRQISDSGELERVVEAIIAANPEQVAQYRAGKEKVFAYFVGQAMKATRGKANPVQLNEILKRKLVGEQGAGA